MKKEIINLDASFLSMGNAVGKKEKAGPLGEYFDISCPDDRYGQKTWEAAESEMQRLAFNIALSKRGLTFEDVGAVFAGDPPIRFFQSVRQSDRRRFGSSAHFQTCPPESSQKPAAACRPQGSRTSC